MNDPYNNQNNQDNQNNQNQNTQFANPPNFNNNMNTGNNQPFNPAMQQQQSDPRQIVGQAMQPSYPAQNMQYNYPALSEPMQPSYPATNIQNTYPAPSEPMQLSYPATNMENEAHKEKLVEDDIEGGNPEVDFTQMIRLGFIRKVYGILSTQLCITVALCSLTFYDNWNTFFKENIWLFWTCLAISLVTAITLICFKSIARKVPVNYAILFIWTFCESYMVATCCSFYEPSVVITAASLTAAVTIALTVYACTTKTDFTFLGGMLFVAICLLFFFGIFAWIFSSQILYTFYCVCGVLVYSIYLIYDTQLVMGNLGVSFMVDDYILAAMMIYIDIIEIFLYLLRIFGGRR